MSGIATAIVTSAAVGAGASYLASREASSATDDAADTTLKASREANALQKEMFQQSREDLAPWREAGTRALTTLEGKINAGPGEFNPETDPGYQFGYQEFVEKPSLRMASATGRLGSGRTLRELTRYASDYATTKYDNFLDRWYKSLAPLQSVAGLGQSSASQDASTAASTGANMAGNALTTGQSIAQSQLYGGQARASGYTGMGNAANAAAQNYLLYSLLK